MAQPNVVNSRKTAELSDIEAILVRPLTGSESEYAAKLLARAARLTSKTISDAGLNPDPELVFDVQASMVARALQNRTGMVQESDGQYSYTLADRSVPGDGLYLTQRDMELLGLADSGVHFWTPQYGEPGSPVIPTGTGLNTVGESR